jgi:hypothetical protein
MHPYFCQVKEMVNVTANGAGKGGASKIVKGKTP